jgi:hypothetical protein
MATHPFFKQTGLDISGEPDEADQRSLAEIEAFARSDRYVHPTQETTERFQQMREMNTDAVREYRWEKQDELARESERIGRIVTENNFLSQLQRVATAKYNDWATRGMRGLSVWKDDRWQYVCAVQCGYMPEYSVMTFDEHGLPLAEKYRGWRTVLLRLVTQGFVSEERVHQVFGAPPSNAASRRYREHLWRYRNREKNG